MDLPIYDGNIHPNEWLKQVQTYCFLKKITKDEEILKLAIMVIDSTIKVPENITSLDELMNSLKQDISHSIFKLQMKKKLKLLNYIPEAQGGETSKFINTFRRLCRDAEINNIQEQKKYFYESLSNNYYLQSELYKKMENVNSTSELIVEFRNAFIDESNLIRNGSIVTLKHVSTGKYLSSTQNLNYQTGSESQLVFVNGLLDSNALWKITFTSGKELASYTDITNYMCLQHKNSGMTFGIYIRSINGYRLHDDYKSPVASHIEGYLKSNDTINLSINNFNNQPVFLRSHDFQFTIGNDSFQEVVCHNERLGGNDEWCIELYY
ncbi:19717_t:CDS:2 [Funneliformis geosporum]|uniref:13823_t:CDS:1 n=1 Tax=Funneliformis geosporum TaxID=1117311 RepID=A0A9W4S9V4_9GLOM|nr:13823_t:CDS:2 [Funneliformis geosporum]CAI2162947.1 19717_t:CDS:2 [Funneliformis geosporum]